MVPPFDPPKVHGDAGRDEGNDDERLSWRCKHCPTEQKQTDAAKDDGRCDPRFVRALQVRLLDPQDDKAEHGEEVEGVAGDAVECEEGGELADEDVAGRQGGVEGHCIDRGEEYACIVRDESDQLIRLRRPASASTTKSHCGPASYANLSKNLGQIPLLTSSVDKPARCESSGVEGAKAGSRNRKSED